MNSTSKPKLFFDSSALIAGVISAVGADRALLEIAEEGLISLVVSEQVIAETERALAAKAPRALPFYRQALRETGLRITANPTREEVKEHFDIISDPADVPIVLAAMAVGADFLVTLDRQHFIDDPGVAMRSGLAIGTPGDALTQVRSYLTGENEEWRR